MTLTAFLFRVRRRLYGYYLRTICKKDFLQYCRYYASYRHSLQHSASAHYHNYIAARPNPGAGIGHQMANWMAGYHLSKLLGLGFAHIPFSNLQHPFKPTAWDTFLGFGHEETTYASLRSKGYKRVLLPRFDLNVPSQLHVIKQIVASYADQKVVFLCEQDQFYRDLQTLIPDIQHKFYAAPARKTDTLIFDPQHCNVAIHVRRGDIMADLSHPNLAIRYLSNNYFQRVLHQTLQHIQSDKPIHVYFFSQGKPEDFPEFSTYPNLHWCFDMDAMTSFLHMVYADVLIPSKSSFSYKPALLNRGIKVSPQNFWHGYPKDKNWWMADDEGKLIR